MTTSFDTTIVRPWQWGIVIVGDSRGELPELEPGVVASIGAEAIVICVRHAQDVVIPEGAAADDEVGEATATVHVRVLASFVPPDRPLVCDVTLAIPSGRVSIGDADGASVIDWTGTSVRVVASANELDLSGLDEVWVDLVQPAPPRPHRVR